MRVFSAAKLSPWRTRRCVRTSVSLLLPMLLWCGRADPSSAQQGAASKSDSDVLQYISAAWTSLTRSMNECKSLVDPKLAQRPILYLPADFAEPLALTELQSRCNV